MKATKNPSPAEIARIVDGSTEKAAKWLEDKRSGDRWFWPAEMAFHRDVAASLGLERQHYRKGIAAREDGRRNDGT